MEREIQASLSAYGDASTYLHIPLIYNPWVWRYTAFTYSSVYVILKEDITIDY